MVTYESLKAVLAKNGGPLNYTSDDGHWMHLNFNDSKPLPCISIYAACNKIDNLDESRNFYPDDDFDAISDLKAKLSEFRFAFPFAKAMLEFIDIIEKHDFECKLHAKLSLQAKLSAKTLDDEPTPRRKI